MGSERSMTFRRLLTSRLPLVCATAAALGCQDPSPVAVDLQMPPLLAARPTQPPPTGTNSGLVVCPQAYDSATKVIGPKGDTLQVGPHILFVDALALTDTVRITAVAPADTIRRVRLEPDGLVFQTGLRGVPAVLYTSYEDCGLPTSDTPRIAQVSDSLSILGYLEPYVQTKKVPWSQANQFVAGVLSHFSNYAIAW
jgi:hypothetical protein